MEGWQKVPREDHVVGAVTAVELESLLSLISPNDAAEKCSGAVLNSFIYQNQGKILKHPDSKIVQTLKKLEKKVKIFETR